IPALLILELLARQGRSLSQLLAHYRAHYFISGEINSQVADQQAKIEEISARYADAEQSRLDGISVDYEDSHYNVRPSNTAPLPLLDSGPNSAKAMDELEQALAAHGHAVEDIELLIVTHQHIDHFGLASILARRSGAEVAALDLLAPYLARFGREAEAGDGFA